MKRPKQQKRISPAQESRFFRILAILLGLALLWVLFAPGSGLFTYWSKRGEVKKLQRDISQLETENIHLQKEIDRLHNDPQYLEEIARKEYGLLKKNERVYDFSTGRSTNDE